MPKVTTSYTCTVCERTYDNEADALACEASKPEPIVKVGDIVFARAGFSWFDGDQRWISNPDVELRRDGKKSKDDHGNCFLPCCTFRFYYVVTAIDMERSFTRTPGHAVRYHLATKAMTNSGYSNGYTLKDHYKPVLVKNPPSFVVEDSRDLIGKTSDRLI